MWGDGQLAPATSVHNIYTIIKKARDKGSTGRKMNNLRPFRAQSSSPLIIALCKFKTIFSINYFYHIFLNDHLCCITVYLQTKYDSVIILTLTALSCIPSLTQSLARGDCIFKESVVEPLRCMSDLRSFKNIESARLLLRGGGTYDITVFVIS